MELRKALDQISEIHGHLAKSEIYKSYKSLPIALSGILAIAAARFWPSSTVVAIDEDPLAVTTARDNAAHNHVTGEISTSPLDVVAVEQPFDLVVANIQENVLLALADAMLAALAPHGILILSGLLTEQAAGVAAAYSARGLEVIAIRTSEADREWSAVMIPNAANIPAVMSAIETPPRTPGPPSGPVMLIIPLSACTIRSNAARVRYGPSWPNPEIEQYTMRGLRWRTRS